jgi:hypothetical protein
MEGFTGVADRRESAEQTGPFHPHEKAEKVNTTRKVEYSEEYVKTRLENSPLSRLFPDTKDSLDINFFQHFRVDYDRNIPPATIQVYKDGILTSEITNIT